MKVCVSDKKLRSLIGKNFPFSSISGELVEDFRNWLQKQTKELNQEEQKGELFQNWLLDIAKYFPVIK
jgi:hypothetical protein